MSHRLVKCRFSFLEKDVLEHVIGLVRGSSFLIPEIVCLSNTFEILNKADTKILFICLLIWWYLKKMLTLRFWDSKFSIKCLKLCVLDLQWNGYDIFTLWLKICKLLDSANIGCCTYNLMLRSSTAAKKSCI